MRRPVIAIMCNVEGEWSARGPAPGGEAWAYRQAIAGQYVDAVWEAGGLPVLLPALDDEELFDHLLGSADGLLITGGSDVAPYHYGAEPSPKLGFVSPHRDAADRLAVAYAQANPELPVLGICRGIQTYNVFAGGTLIQDIPSEVAGAVQHSQKGPAWAPGHRIDILEPDSITAAIFAGHELLVNSFHHQAADEPAPGLQVVARAPDGVIEAMERPSASWCVLVQWHPEQMVGRVEHARRLFEAFVQACKSG